MSPSASITVRCIQGPDAGKSYQVGEGEVALGKLAGVGVYDDAVAERHLTLSWRGGSLYFRTEPGQWLYIDQQPVSMGTLPDGQYFQLGHSIWQAGSGAAPGAPRAGSVVDSLAARLREFASTDKLEGFSLGQLFSEVFKKRTPEEVEDYFIAGTSKTTPPIEEADSNWPKPWLFVRVLVFASLVYGGFAYAWETFHNRNLLPGLIIIGGFATPLATLFLFFELNAPRNVSFYRVLILVVAGGVVSLFVSLAGFEVSGEELDWMGASSAGIVEEIGKFLTVVILIRGVRYKYILNGLLFGCAVAAGFAGFESAGFAFREYLKTGAEGMRESIHLRAFLAPFGHVAWTAITAGAFWRVKGDRPLDLSMFGDRSFLKAFAIPMVLHMIWNSPIRVPFLPSYSKQLILGTIGWFVVFGLAQQGLWQVRQEQKRVTTEHWERAKAAGS